MRIKAYFSFFLIFFTVLCGVTVRLSAEVWTFGIVPDTQWNQGDPFEGVAVHVIDAINTEMVRRKVDFVIAVGDLADVSSLEALRMRDKHNEILREAGIAFYPLRGNHDSSTLRSMEYFTEVFPNLPGTPGQGGSSPNLPNAKGKTYAFTHKGVKLILLDSFPLVDDGSERGKAYAIKDYLPWMEEELEKNDYHAAFVFSHLALAGQKHKSNLFGKVRLTQNNHSDVQNAFYSLMQRRGVKYLFCGHDHLYHRSQITSPDEKSQIQQIICGSASDKFYRPKYPFMSRERPLSQELDRVGFLIGRVDDDRVRFEYYSTDPFGEQAYAPCWELRESFGYDFKDNNKFEQTAAEMKKIYRPTILSVVASLGAVGLLPIITALIIFVRVLRSRKRLFFGKTDLVEITLLNRSHKTTAQNINQINVSRLLKWKILLPVLFVLLCIPAVIDFRLPFESHTWDHILEICCLFVGLFGLAVRALAHGYEPSNSQESTDLSVPVDRMNTHGVYAYMRYPLVPGNFFLFLAPVMFLHTWWLVVVYVLVYVVYSGLFIQEKETSMQNFYGPEYTNWTAKTPRIIPKSFRWMIPGNGFSWKKAVLHEYRYFFGFVIVMTTLEHLGNFMVFGTIVPSPVWASFLAFGAGTYLFVYSLVGTSLLCVIVFFMLVGSTRTAKGQLASLSGQGSTVNQCQSNPVGFSIYDTPITMAHFSTQTEMGGTAHVLTPARNCGAFQMNLYPHLQPSPLNTLSMSYHTSSSFFQESQTEAQLDPEPMFVTSSSYRQAVPFSPQPDHPFEPESPSIACVPSYARPLQDFLSDERKNFPAPVPQKPTHLQSLFTVAGNTKNRVFEDYRNLYTRDNALNYGVAVMGASVLANTQMDHNFQNWYHKRAQCWTTDQFSEFSKIFGEGQYFIPATLTTAFAYRYWQERTGNQSTRRPVGDFFGRTARGYAVGAPTLLIGQYVFGGDRPGGGSSYWQPFQRNHGISGHAFMGATPFITAAHMTDKFWAKSTFYTLSILPAWSRVNDDAHYLSQAILGWYLSYLSVRAVSETEGLKPLPKGLTLFPVFEGGGTFGIGLNYRR